MSTTAGMPLPAASLVDRLRASRLVAVLRASTADHFLPVAEVLVESGFDVVEITLTTPRSLESLHDLVSRLPSNVLVGAGTVVDEQQARAAMAAGATFLVSPAVSLPVLRAGLAAGVPVVPGALTPTEFAQATREGAAVVKLFPACAFGPDYLHSLRGPFPDLAVMPTGGIAVDAVRTWLEAGAVSVGLGGALTGDAVAGGSLTELALRARRALASRDATARGVEAHDA